MKLYKTLDGPLVETNGEFHRLTSVDWDALINRDDLFEYLQGAVKSAPIIADFAEPPIATLLPPIGTQEVWAAGVTYSSGRAAGGALEGEQGAIIFYRHAYHADRPQLFFKAPHYRVAGSGQAIQIRRDSTWTFPEPELTLFATSSGKIVAYTIGNDVSSGSIEAENPLYLTQAKTHDGCAALGPCLLVTEEPINPETCIRLSIVRYGTEFFAGATQWKLMKRPLPELTGYLFRETSFAQGVFLMTGTGVIPPLHCTLQRGDHIAMTIDGIGTLHNDVTQRP